MESLGLIYFGIFLFIYFIPTIVASHRNKKNMGVVVIVNLFLGWTFIGWIVALAMSFGDRK